MGDTTKIQWCDATFNAWIGCEKVSPGCKHCYAAVDTYARVSASRGLPLWGPGSSRHVTSDANWRKPLAWNRAAEREGVRRRVFCSSLSDVFEDRPDLVEPRARLATLIANTPHLDWLVLTKRPEHAHRLWCDAAESSNHPAFEVAASSWLPNIWLGTTCEYQAHADERIPHLLAVPAAVRFVSYEPALGPVDFNGWGNLSQMLAQFAPRDSWESFEWPAWVPSKSRAAIEKFWATTYGRGPRDWLRDHAVQHVPATGTEVVCADDNGWANVNKMAAHGVRGRYVHLWNNIGQVVTDDGNVVHASGGIGSGWLSHWLTRHGTYKSKLNWIIIGGESGPGARPFDLAWMRSVVRQCREAKVAAFCKQLGAKPYDSSIAVDVDAATMRATTGNTLRLRDPKGGNVEEWPEGDWPREFPRGGS